MIKDRMIIRSRIPKDIFQTIKFGIYVSVSVK